MRRRAVSGSDEISLAAGARRRERLPIAPRPTITTAASIWAGAAGTGATWWNGDRSSTHAGAFTSAADELDEIRDHRRSERERRGEPGRESEAEHRQAEQQRGRGQAVQSGPGHRAPADLRVPQRRAGPREESRP